MQQHCAIRRIYNVSDDGERLEKELRALEPTWQNVRVIALADRKYSAWLGGSMMASLPSFKEKWITKEEYDEEGPRIVHKKCLMY